MYSRVRRHLGVVGEHRQHVALDIREITVVTLRVSMWVDNGPLLMAPHIASLCAHPHPHAIRIRCSPLSLPTHCHSTSSMLPSSVGKRAAGIVEVNMNDFQHMKGDFVVVQHRIDLKCHDAHTIVEITDIAKDSNILILSVVREERRENKQTQGLLN